MSGGIRQRCFTSRWNSPRFESCPLNHTANVLRSVRLVGKSLCHDPLHQSASGLMSGSRIFPKTADYHVPSLRALRVLRDAGAKQHFGDVVGLRSHPAQGHQLIERLRRFPGGYPPTGRRRSHAEPCPDPSVVGLASAQDVIARDRCRRLEERPGKEPGTPSSSTVLRPL